MKLTLHTEVAIDSAHQLINYKGKCANIHGHTWKVELWFRGDSSSKDDVGIMVDFGIVKDLKELLDHKFINDIMPNNINPTAENLTEFIYDYLKKIIKKQIDVKVRVYETYVEKITYCEGGDFI